MDLSIIIVNWNSVEFLKACITSIQRGTRDLNYEIIVIDCASFDGCSAMLRYAYPSVRFIQSTRNVGFGRANNIAFEQARGKAILFLNPDTEVIGSAISRMYEWLQKLPSVGAVGCRLLNTDLSIQTSCVQTFPTIANQILDAEWMRSRWPTARLWGTAALYDHDDTPKPVEAIAGACVMLKREVFQVIGHFSDEYFMYAEDIDLCYKTHAIGLTNYYIPDATVIHHGGGCAQEAPSNFSVVLTRESICRFLSKNRGQAYGALYRLAMFVAASLRLMLLQIGSIRGRLRNDHQSASLGSLRKWRAVLRWSLFRQEMVKQFEPTV